LFSLEMPTKQLVNRMIISETEIDSDKIRSGKLDTEEWAYLNSKIAKLIDAPVFIDDTPQISVSEFRAKCRRLVQRHGIKIAVIDYLQLMAWTGDTRGNREQEVSNISRSLKATAKELDIPIIALSQLNRAVESRTGIHKRPHLADLRESGAIEQDADIVTFIHRPEKYGITEDQDGNSLLGFAELIIAKHRNGALDDIPLTFKSQYAKFVEAETYNLSLGVPQIIPSKMNDEVMSIDAEYGNSSFPVGGAGEVDAPF